MVRLVALVDDLMFLSRIREAAAAPGTEVKAVRDAAALVEACRDAPAFVMADLDSPRLHAADAIRALRSDPIGSGLQVIGFVSHVNAAGAQDAIAAGASKVMARSSFVRELPALVAAARRPE